MPLGLLPQIPTGGSALRWSSCSDQPFWISMCSRLWISKLPHYYRGMTEHFFSESNCNYSGSMNQKHRLKKITLDSSGIVTHWGVCFKNFLCYSFNSRFPKLLRPTLITFAVLKFQFKLFKFKLKLFKFQSEYLSNLFHFHFASFLREMSIFDIFDEQIISDQQS